VCVGELISLPWFSKELKPKPNKTNLAAQSKYMTQEAVKTKKQAKQNCDDSLARASESIRNMNEIEDSNKKTETKYKKNETTPRYVGYDENKLQEMKTIESKRISKVDAKQTRLRRVKSEFRT